MRQIAKAQKKRFRIAIRNVSQNHEDSFEVVEVEGGV
jgi:hypothetical protein